jgi:hypothetical protein
MLVEERWVVVVYPRLIMVEAGRIVIALIASFWSIGFSFSYLFYMGLF